MNNQDFINRIKCYVTSEKTEKAMRNIAGIDRNLQAKTYNSVRKHDDLILHMRENEYGARKVIQAQFRTLGCRMKKLGSCWNCNYGIVDKCLITPNQYIKAFKREIEKVTGDVLVLETLGSITDPKEFDQSVLKEIIKIAIENGDFNYISLETHVTQITEQLAKYMYMVNGGRKELEFEIGVEDMNPDNRKLINKIGVDNTRIKTVYDMLEKYGINLGINLIYGFPFMNEQERVDAVINSVKTISDNMPKAEIVLFLMSTKENTIMEYMQNNQIYKPANPWGLVEVLSRILEDGNIGNTITFSWFGEKVDPYINEETCYSCEHCKEQIVEFFRRINGTFDNEKRRRLLNELLQRGQEADCRCYENFKEQLKQKDGKNPSTRYTEFIEWMSELGEK